MIRVARYYGAQMRHSLVGELQYRTAAFLLLVGFLFEPIVYLVVWRSVAESQGGAVGGYTAAAFTAYFIVWTLVRAMNLALTPYVWDWRIQRGRPGKTGVTAPAASVCSRVTAGARDPAAQSL